MIKIHKSTFHLVVLMSLEMCRVRDDVTEVFKILIDGFTNDADLFFKYDEGGRRGHSKKLFKRRSRLDIRKYVCLVKSN